MPNKASVNSRIMLSHSRNNFCTPSWEPKRMKQRSRWGSYNRKQMSAELGWRLIRCEKRWKTEWTLKSVWSLTTPSTLLIWWTKQMQSGKKTQARVRNASWLRFKISSRLTLERKKAFCNRRTLPRKSYRWSSWITPNLFAILTLIKKESSWRLYQFCRQRSGSLRSLSLLSRTTMKSRKE